MDPPHPIFAPNNVEFFDRLEIFARESAIPNSRIGLWLQNQKHKSCKRRNGRLLKASVIQAKQTDMCRG